MALFKNRFEAGEELSHLIELKDKKTEIIGLSGGGVDVARAIALKHKKKLGVLVVKKVKAPNNPQFTLGFVAENGIEVKDEAIIKALEISELEWKVLTKKTLDEIEQTVSLYRNNIPLPSMMGKRVVMVDDGLGSGLAAEAGIKAIRKLKPAEIIYASPVCPRLISNKIRRLVEELVCLISPSSTQAINKYYEDLEEITDANISQMLMSRTFA